MLLVPILFSMNLDSAVYIALAAGLAGGLQIAVAGEFGKRVGVLEATAVSAFMGLLLVLILTFVRGKGLSGMVEAFRQPAWLWLAGTIGGFYVITLTYAPPRIGTLATIAILIVGQLIAGAVVDSIGLFGEPVPLDLARVSGLLLLAVGALLVLRR
jgi:bacterial/archaeal transporter family-2 protein